MTDPHTPTASPGTDSMHVPRVSIIMPAYNSAPYIQAAIDSVLAQTFEDFELIVVDDCSPDECSAICQSYSDSRLRLIQLPENKGQATARNTAIAMARGEFIGFLDSDDVAVPERLATQMAYFEQNPNCILVGAGYRRMTADGQLLAGDNIFPLPARAIRSMLMMRNYLNISTVTFRRTALPPGGFRSMFAEDYEFITRIAENSTGEMVNLPHSLTYYRVNPCSLSNTTRRVAVLDALWEIQQPILARLGLHASPEEREAHQIITFSSFDGVDFALLKRVDRWLKKIVDANTRVRYFDEKDLNLALGEAWFRLCYASCGEGYRVVRIYLTGCAHGLRRDTFTAHLRFFAKAILRRGYVAQDMKLGVK